MKRNDSMLTRHLTTFCDPRGLKVMEVGCGNGELTRQLSTLVGPEGSIVALDNNCKALESAKAQIGLSKYKNMQFIEGDISNFPIDFSLSEAGSFDLLVGRRILMYLAQPAAVIKELSQYLKKGGIAVFQESDPTITPASIDEMPAHDQASEWLRAMLVKEDVHMTMGFNLPKTLAGSGLEFKKVFAEAVIQGQGEQFELADMIKLLTQRLLGAGIATQIEITHLIERLVEESKDKSNVYISDMSFCAWAQKT